jgi:hypothetical protein
MWFRFWLPASSSQDRLVCSLDSLDSRRCPGASVHEVLGIVEEINGIEGDIKKVCSSLLSELITGGPCSGDAYKRTPSLNQSHKQYMMSGIFRGVDPLLAGEIAKLPLYGGKHDPSSIVTPGLCNFFLSHVSHLFRLPPCEVHSQCAAPGPSCRHAGLPLRTFVAAQPLGTVLWMMRKAGNMVGRTALVLGQGQNGAYL